MFFHCALLCVPQATAYLMHQPSHSLFRSSSPEYWLPRCCRRHKRCRFDPWVRNVSNSVWPHRRQPNRLPGPWDSPGKNTGVGCHFLLQCMKVKSQSEVAQSCPTLSDPMDCSPPGSSVHGIFRAIVLEWGAIAFSELYLLCLLLHSYICGNQHY